MINCKNCNNAFEVTDEDRKFYEMFDVPEPDKCPEHRMQQRLVFRNERNLYQRKCGLSGRSMITTYGPETPFPVYDQEAWYGDGWEATEYGQDYDFNRSFFEQFEEVYNKVPRVGLLNQKADNSAYCNYANENKNCYLMFGGHYNEDTLYSTYTYKAKSSMECHVLNESELCYEMIDSSSCYSSSYLHESASSNNCYFSYFLEGCNDCLFSSNLYKKQYYVLNELHTKEEYEAKLSGLDLGSYEAMQSYIAKFYDMKNRMIHRATDQLNSEGSIGSNVLNSKNVYHGFNTNEAEDARYLMGGMNTHLKNSMDTSFIGYDMSELLYQCINCNGDHKAMFCVSVWHSAEIYYSELCMDSTDLFGCVGLKNKKYCILNKQYTKEEYEELKKKIIEKMKADGEWGQFFPMSLSAFPYNKSVANEYIPLEKEEAIELGLKWEDPDPKEYRPQTYEIPDHIKDVKPDILEAVLACVDCGKNYKIVQLELSLYKNKNHPIPRKCPDCRHLERVKHWRKLKLWQRKCDKCGNEVPSTYAPEEPITVYCEPCHSAMIY